MASKEDPSTPRDQRAVDRDLKKHDDAITDIQQKLHDLSTGQFDAQNLAQMIAQSISDAQMKSATLISKSVTQPVPEQQTVKMPQLDVTKMTGRSFRSWRNTWNDYFVIKRYGLLDDKEQMCALRMHMSVSTKERLDELKIADDKKNDVNHTLDELETFLSEQANPAIERKIFMARKQRENESIGQFVMSLRELSRDCDYPDDFLDSALRDQVLMNAKSVFIRDKLAALGKQLQSMSFSSFLSKCRELEQRELDRDRMKAGDWSQPASDPHVGSVSGRGRGRRKGRGRGAAGNANGVGGNGNGGDRGGRPNLDVGKHNPVCLACNIRHRPNNQCPAYNQQCRHCKAYGHFESRCPVKLGQQSRGRGNGGRNRRGRNGRRGGKGGRVGEAGFDENDDEDQGGVGVVRLGTPAVNKLGAT